VAQTPDGRLVDRLSPAVIDSVTVLVRAATDRGLPVEPLIQKTLEGQSKRAADTVIIAAVEDLLKRLQHASSALGADVSGAVLVAAAGAIHVGVSTETLRSLATTYRNESLAVPLVVLTDMIRKGVELGTASELLGQLLEARVDIEDLQRFRRLVERDINLGAVPGEAAMIRARGVLLEQRRGGPPFPPA
jgi:hypothetical protein